MTTRPSAGPQAPAAPAVRSDAAGPRVGRPGAAVRGGRHPGRWFTQVGWRHVVGVLAVAFSLFPILFVLSAALNPLGTLSSTELLPTGASLSNFGDLFERTEFGRWFLNSLLVAGGASCASIFLSSLAAYAFSRMRFAGRRFGLLTLLLIQMFPQFLAIVAIFLIFTRVTDLWPSIGFNTPWGLLLLYMGGALGMNTWLMKGFFDTLPRELDESATMDGASHAQVFFRIMLPLVAPILAVTALLSFIGTINEFMIANVFLTDTGSKTLAVGMFGLVAGERNNNFGIFAAGTLLTAVPTVLVFQLLQRYIVSGLTAGAVKG
ncbi:sugar ABC transporter permease [Micromonospora wenchangensis]|uniref:Sugar ABC transporter permease n=1 Tax=Micromonospora wenchangensis TaxID=1185415 RepID=A0A246RN08_9ACTN|nr:sugar ABC transporter permease [Micromonospora wenchangensis]